MPEPEVRKRRRPAVVCNICRRRKLKCDRELPCANCTRSKATCIYDNPRQHAGASSTAAGHGHSTAVKRSTTAGPETSFGISKRPFPLTPATIVSRSSPQRPTSEVEQLENRIKQLEHQLLLSNTRSQRPTRSSRVFSDSTALRLGGSVYLHHDLVPASKGSSNVTQAVSHKTRLLGQTHWLNVITLFQDIFELVEPSLYKDNTTVFSNVLKCKTVSRDIKLCLEPPWPTLPTSDLPSRELADELVACYLQHSESIHRVLIVPHFQQSYEAIWTNEDNISTDFIILLKLVMAIGAVTYDDQFSLRAEAIRWVHEALAWICAPRFKSRLSIQALQINILLLIARELVGVGNGQSIWISAGDLLRRAMAMGLHRDTASLSDPTILDIQMRRRLWNTILEIALGASLASGASPMLDLDLFETEPPGNFDDVQLLTEDPLPRREDERTQTSIAIAFRKSFALRLAVTRYLNDSKSKSTYEETLRFDKGLRAAGKSLFQTLHAWLPTDAFELHVMRFVMHHYICSLHIPFFGPSIHEATFAYSRKVVVDMALKLWHAACPRALTQAMKTDSETHNHGCHVPLVRIAACGSGLHHTVAFQAALLIAAELRAQIQEDDAGDYLTPLRPDLLDVVKNARDWCLQCIEVGETNAKGYLLTCVVAAAIEGEMEGKHDEELSGLMITTAESSLEQSLRVLEDMLSRLRSEHHLDEVPTSDMAFELADEWDLMNFDSLLTNEAGADLFEWSMDVG